jgi:aminoglycoside phosphotransferase (APT) family kinase protein
VLQHVHGHAPGLVPQPVAADLDTVPPTVIMTVVPGVPLRGALAPSHLDALASAIGALWAVPFDSLAKLGPWKDILPFARRLTAGPRPASGVTAAAYDAALAWWAGPDPALLRLAPHAKVLGHGDANLANYLWDGRRVRIVDLEDARISDPATELANLVEHLSARSVNTEALSRRFDSDPARFLAARRVWAMFWLRLLLPGGSSEGRNPPGTCDAQARRLMSLLDGV